MPFNIASKIIDRAERRLNARQAPPPLTSLFEFGQKFFGQVLVHPLSAFHRHFIPDLERIRVERGVRLNRIAYRGAAKTSWLTIHIAQCICHRLERYIVLVKNTHAQAKKDLVPLVDAFRDGNDLTLQFGICVLSHSVDHLETTNGVRVEIYGLDQELHGIKYRHHRPTLLICDDIQGVADIHSPVYRQASRDRFHHMLLPIGTPATNIVVVGNALHREAIVCELSRNGLWNTASYPAIVREPARMDLWNGYRDILCDADRANPIAEADAFYAERRELMDAGAVIDWPERFPLQFLMKQRFTTSLSAFKAQWQNDPHDPSRSEWPQEDDAATGQRAYFDWDGFYYTELPAGISLRSMGVDPSKGASDAKGDYQAIVKLAVAANGIRYVDPILKRENVEAFADRFVREVRDFQPHVIFFEANQWQALLKAPIRERAKALGVKLTMVREIENTENKALRIRRLGDGLAARRYRFRAGTPGTLRTIEQAKDFPNGAHDDGLDAWEMADRAANAPTSIGMAGGGW